MTTKTPCRAMTIAAAAATCLLSAAPGAQAEACFDMICGMVDQVRFDPYDPTAGLVHVDTPMFAFYWPTFIGGPANTPPDADPSPGHGFYAMVDALPVFFISLGVLSKEMHMLNVDIVDGAAGNPDRFVLTATTEPFSNPNDTAGLWITLIDPTGTALDSDRLTARAPAFEDYAVNTFTITRQFVDADGKVVQFEAQGHLMPEPSTLLLLAAPAAALTALRRRVQAGRR